MRIGSALACRAGLIGSAALVALALGACGAAPPSGPVDAARFGFADLPDPCALLTTDEVAAALGVPINEPSGEREMLDAECTYAAQAAKPERSVLVELSALGPNSASFEQRARFFQTEGARPIAGFDAPAYAKQGAVLTRTPATILFVIVTDDTRDQQVVFAVARSLTRKVLSRLP